MRDAELDRCRDAPAEAASTSAAARAIGTPVTENAVPAKARAAAGATSRCCVWQRRISSCRISFLRAFSICANGINVSVGIAPRLIHEFCKQFGPPGGVWDAAPLPVLRHHN